MHIDQQRTWNLLSNDPGNFYVNGSDEERALLREWTTGLLRERTVNITFDKADGTERTMPCTLQEQQLPKTTASQQPVKYNPDVCRVFDPERQVWRSFRWDRLKRIEFELG